MDLFPAVRPDVPMINGATRHLDELSSLTHEPRDMLLTDLYPRPNLTNHSLCGSRHMSHARDLPVGVVRHTASPIGWARDRSTAILSAGRLRHGAPPNVA